MGHETVSVKCVSGVTAGRPNCFKTKREDGMADQPKPLFDIVLYQLGVGRQGGQPSIGVLFQLRNGASLGVAMPPKLATDLATQMMAELRKLADEPPLSRN
jgi:hypothetical protein